MPVIEGARGLRFVTGAPVAGTDEVQTLTFGGTPTSGTFRLSFYGTPTAAITWSSTNATLVANIDAALEAHASIGAAGVVTAVGSMTNGIGTITVTFSGTAMAKRAVPLMTVVDNLLAGTSPTLAVTETTPGVDSTERGAPIGALLIRDNGTVYANTGTALTPTWTVVGTQT